MDLDRQASSVSALAKTAIFRRHELFQALGPEVCEQLAAHAKIKDVPRGTTIFMKGAAGTCLFAVCRGVVLVTNTSSDGKSLFLNEIKEGEIFGEIALLDGQPRTADAAAFTDCSLIVIERRDFLPLLRSNPDVMLKLVEILCSRLRRTTEQVEDLMFMDLRGRLAKTLLRLSQSAGDDRTLDISQNELSQMVGLSREMINKQLQVWVREGYLKIERRRLIILQPQALADILTAS
jgi:CRP-like cAMP-binding protein|uniref:Transcriptional regulator, Crp/Fnr family n=1 Tax=Rhodopseudomonas palustris (strain BisA53) TaxID=316055 RepID=Q07HN5_RHOP5